MTRTQFSAIAIAISALFTGQAMAADNGAITRADVKAELSQAIASGNMLIDESGQRFKDVFPHNYAADNVASKSREQVRAELAEARRSGNIVIDESGQRLNDVFAQNYQADNVASKTREEVRTELAEAINSGSYLANIPA